MSETMKRPDLRVQIASLEMKNPVMVASGTFGYGPEYADLVDLDRLGAVIVKGIGLHPHLGNPTPRTFETASGMLNAIGLPGPGAEGFIKKHLPFFDRYSVPLIVNIWGKTIDEYRRVVEILNDSERIHAMEINVSCPNVKEGGAFYGTDLDLFCRVVGAVRPKTQKPVIIKLAPNVADIKPFARVAEGCGADGLSIMNSYPAMAIDIETRKPQLANRTGGLSGPAIKPIAVKLVWEAAQAVHIPIIGMGGIASPEDDIGSMDSLPIIQRVGKTYRYYLTELGRRVLVASCKLFERVILLPTSSRKSSKNVAHNARDLMLTGHIRFVTCCRCAIQRQRKWCGSWII